MEISTTYQMLEKQHANHKEQCIALKRTLAQTSDTALLQHHILSFWRNELQAHLETEEQTLIPFLRSMQFNAGLINMKQREDNTLRLLAHRVSLLTNNETYVCRIFVDILEAHTDFEEKIIFAKMKETFNNEAWEQLDRLMDVYKNSQGK